MVMKCRCCEIVVCEIGSEKQNPSVVWFDNQKVTSTASYNRKNET